ncbi:MAG: ribonuclease P protein component [Minisyncoccia bacterium]|jgi:ribonuclease P protein component
MLKKQYKLKKEDFVKVLNNHEVKENKYFILFYQKNNTCQTHYGVIVSSKISRLATERNLLKRRIKAILNQKINLIPQGFNVIIIAKSYSLNKEYDKLEQGLIELLMSLS